MSRAVDIAAAQLEQLALEAFGIDGERLFTSWIRASIAARLFAEILRSPMPLQIEGDRIELVAEALLVGLMRAGVTSCTVEEWPGARSHVALATVDTDRSLAEQVAGHAGVLVVGTDMPVVACLVHDLDAGRLADLHLLRAAGWPWPTSR